MMDTYMRDDTLDKAIDAFFEKLIEKKVIQENQKNELKTTFTKKLLENYKDNAGNVPKTLFTDPKERQKLVLSIMSFLVAQKNPALKSKPEFDPMLLFKDELKPEQKKSLFKHLLLELKPKNKSTKTKAQEAEEEKELDKMLHLFMDELDKKEKENGDASPTLDLLEHIYEILYGQNYFGQTTITAAAGQNTQAVNDDKPVTSWLQGLFGTLHKGRDLTSQNVNSYVEANAESRLLSLSGLNKEAYDHIQSAHPSILHQTGIKPPSPFNR